MIFIKTIISIVAIFYLLLMPSSDILACQPCPEMLTMQETVDEADLVIVGHRVDYNSKEKQPEGIKIYVERVFKGDIEKYSEITVRTMYGMCDYGISMQDERALIFLKKLKKPKREWQSIIPHKFDYTSVSYGCAPKILTVIDGAVKIANMMVTLEELEDGQVLIFPPREEYTAPVVNNFIEEDEGE